MSTQKGGRSIGDLMNNRFNTNKITEIKFGKIPHFPPNKY